MSETARRQTTDRGREDAHGARDGGPAPDSPAELPRTHWKSVLKRTVSEFLGDGGPDLAAALTYFSIMSLAPMLLALSTLLTFLGQGGATNEAVGDLGRELGLQESTIATITGYLGSMGETGGAGILLVVGLLVAFWSASNYVNAFSRMMNRVYDVDEGRPVWKLRPWLIALTLVVVVALMIIILSVTLSGRLSELIFGFVGLSGVATAIWNWAKWPFILLMLIGIVALLYWGTPNVRQPKFRWLSPGAALAVIVSILAAAGFFIYLTGFGGEDSYNATYGAIGGVIILLLMIFIINNVLVIGAELDSELERGRELAAGLAAEEEIQLPPRDVKGTKKKARKEAEAVRQARQLRMEAAAQLSEAGEDVGPKDRGSD